MKFRKNYTQVLNEEARPFLSYLPQVFNSVFYFTLCFLSVPLDLDIKYKAILMGATFLIVSTDRAHVTFLTTAKVLCHVSDFV